MKNEKIKSNLGLSSKNDSSSHLANCVCKGVDEDLGYGIGWVTFSSMTCRHLSKDIHVLFECLFACLDAIECALRWGVALVGDYHYSALHTPSWDPLFRYRSSAGS